MKESVLDGKGLGALEKAPEANAPDPQSCKRPWRTPELLEEDLGEIGSGGVSVYTDASTYS